MENKTIAKSGSARIVVSEPKQTVCSPLERFCSLKISALPSCYRQKRKLIASSTN